MFLYELSLYITARCGQGIYVPKVLYSEGPHSQYSMFQVYYIHQYSLDKFDLFQVKIFLKCYVSLFVF